MQNPKYGYTVNLKQRSVAEDHMARLHRNKVKQPKACQLEKVEAFKWFSDLDAAETYCQTHKIPYRQCVHCL